MQMPKLTPLQSRFAASLTASLFLLLVYLSLTKPHFAYATELDSRIPSDHNHPLISDIGLEDEEVLEERSAGTELNIVERQTSGVLELKNNQAQNKQIVGGDTQTWVFTKASINGPAGERGRGLPTEVGDISASTALNLELKKRQSAKQVYISINTCLQPTSKSLNSTLPQLALYYSQSNQKPGPASTNDTVYVLLNGGYALINLTSDTDVYVGVTATSVANLTGYWNYEIAASIDQPYHSYSNDPLLHFVDADTHAALFITTNLTNALPNSTVYKEWMTMPPPYGMLGHDQNDLSILGVSKSYCGLMHSAHIIANLENTQNQNVASMTNRGIGAKPKEQIYITSLNASTNYYGFLAMQGNSTNSGLNVVGGGGQVWASFNFTTKSEPNCALMYNLSFCSEVAYAVPTNPNLFSPSGGLPELARLYDESAQNLYKNFNYSLQQIPCDTNAAAQYSLARNCTDCARAYKQWLCAVTIPRCEDFGNPANYLKPRNVAQPFPNGTVLRSTDQSQIMWTMVASNQSRNALIDDQIKPGPYKEVLPCEDLCYDLVQSCPAALGFGCPSSGTGLEDSYGFRSGDGSEITCSWLGAAYYLSSGEKLVVGTMMRWFVVVVMVWSAFVMGL